MARLKYKKFIIFFLLTSIFYTSLFLIEPIRKLISDQGVTLRDNNLFYLTILVLLINLLVYLYFFRKDCLQGLTFKKVFYCYSALNLVLLFIWPVSSTDVFSYIYQGRILSVYHSNPYLVTYHQFQSDAFYSFIANMWESKSAPYGPLFLLISGLLTWLGKINLYFSIYLFKALFVGANLLTAYFIYKLSDLKTFYLYAFNPLIIFELVINGHNDVLVVLGCVLSIYFLSQEPKLKNYLLAILFLVLSTLIKLTTIIFWPILILLIFKSLKDLSSRLILVISALFIMLLTLAFAYVPFLDNWQAMYLPIINQAELSGFYSLGTYLVKIFSPLFGWPLDLQLSAALNKIIFILFYFTLLLKLAFSRSVILKNFFLKYQTLTFLIFLLTFFTWLMPWYSTVLIALGVLTYDLEKKKIYLNLTYLFTFYGIVYYFFLR